ncbi:uncharacterized protein LOC117611903 [Osmia lignaria lignaria]|uniref:uncharacterized protein LOC117611903 n=1 Tax=Osmia lignaria lignaria TaxID=1437193 RepID=UPI00402B4A5F
MASYRSYGDTGAYRSRVGIAAGTFGRAASSTGSSLPSCRNSYSSIGSGSSRTLAKDRVSGFGNAFLKKDKNEEKPSFKYSTGKDADKSRLHPGRSSSEDVRAKSPLSSSRSSLLEKYSYPAAKTSDRPASVLDRYNRATSREKSREPEGVSRYGSNTYPGSGLARSYGNESRIEKKERADHPPVSYRGLRPNSGRSSREPSPEVSVGKSNTFRMYPRASSYGRSGASSSASESSSTPISSRYGSSSATRFLSSRTGNDRVPAAISYSGSDRFRTSGSKPVPGSSKKEDVTKSPSEKDPSQEPFVTSAKAEEFEVDKRLQESETVTITMITRGTSPSPPASSSFVRNRRADVGIASQKEVARVRKKIDSKDQEVQCEKTEDNSRFLRYGGGGRIAGTPWTTYIDKFSSSNTAGSPGYGRGFNGGAGGNSRMNSFAFSRSNDRNDPSMKVSPNSSQEIFANRNQNEQNNKVFGGLGFPRSSADPKENPRKDQSEGKLQNASCSVGKVEGKVGRLASPQQSGIVGKSQESKSEETQSSRESSTSKSESYNQRRPSIPRLGRGTPKNDVKILRSSSNSSTKSDGLRERRGSTPKSDHSSLSKLDESSRIVEGHCKEQGSEIASPKSDNASGGKESFHGSSQSRSTTPQSRSGSSKNLPRQMTRIDSSDSSAVNVPIGRSKSSSASSTTSQGAKIKATPSCSSPGKSSVGSSASSVNLRQGGSPDARGKPPVPKSDAASSSSSKSIVALKYVNKDFRKSTLNMENGDPSRSKYSRKKKSNQRSVSVSSQDSQSEPNSEPIRQAATSDSSGSVKSSRSRLKMPLSTSKTITKSDSTGNSFRPEKSRSTSKSPSVRREENGTSSSSSNESNSSNSSSSEEDDEEQQIRSSSRRRRKRTSKSPFCEKKGKMSAGSSRTSVLASSADEMSLTMDKPPRPPSSPRSRSDRSGKTEEAKSFLMRALAPVTNLFKNKHQDSSESGKSGGWLDSNEENTDVKKSEHNGTSLSKSLSKSFSFTNSEKTEERKQQSNGRIRRNYSGEQPWWMNPNCDNVPEGVETGSVCNDDISQETTVSGALPDDGKFKYKVWRQESEERAWWFDANDSVASEEAKKQSSTTTSRQESVEKGRWLDSNDSGPSEETKKQSFSTASMHDTGERARWLDGNDSHPSEESKKSSCSTGWRQESGDRGCWLDANDGVPSDDSKKPFPAASPVQKRESSRSSTRSSDKRSRIKHQQSGERAWWMSNDPDNVPEGIEVIPITTDTAENINDYPDEVDDSQSYGRMFNKIRHIESGEKPWWMDSSSKVPDGVVKIPVETSNSTSDSSESFERIDIGVNPEPEIYTKRSLSRFPIEFPPPPPDEPLGDRASPEGVENPPDPPDNYGGRDSPYDNVQPTPRRSSPRKRPSTLPLFIGEHTNIDDLLGDTSNLCPSPVLSRIRKREPIEEDTDEESSECEEIDATQVIIHDSTPKTPVIQRRHRDNERPQPDGYIPIRILKVERSMEEREKLGRRNIRVFFSRHEPPSTV